jgi:hypothetical protein
MNRNDREIRRLCLDVVLLDGEQDAAPSLADMARRAKALLDGALAPRKRVARDVRAVDLRPTKEERKAAKNAETAALRVNAEARAAGRGELCGQPFYDAPECRAEMCHLDGGSGKRTQGQRIGNVVMEHGACHRGKSGLDVAPLAWLPDVKRWCARYGYPLPERFRKLEALAEARSPRGGRQDANVTTKTKGD